ncbi:hypothetical protein J7E62_31990 [Variovorax paradoxus]|nr:hypothetical protein [Variovorax paradoxus]
MTMATCAPRAALAAVFVFFCGTAAFAQFPDAHDSPPSGWSGPVFRLRQDYPQTLPPTGSRPWMAFDFRNQPSDYLKAVLAYALEGNKEVDFVVQNNQTRGWYHAPWMHAGAAGREFVRGLTRERSSRPGELHPNQTGTWENWAVSVYNPRGGYTLGRVWQDPDAPNPAGAKFPVGTVSAKLIFTQAPVSQVPYLAGSVEWQADINRASGTGPRPTLRLLQVDVAVRDSRADSTTGWVFGTFVYDGNAPGATPWDRLVPVGLMWGNDPTRVGTTQPLQQTKINAGLQIPQHLGFEKRLNGPVDNPRSSCLSCHSTAQVRNDLSQPTRAAIAPNNASLQTLRLYFRNIKSGVPFDAGARSLDYSLQLQNGIANWARAAPPSAPAGPQGSAAAARAGRGLDRSRGVNIGPIGRDGDIDGN